MTMPLIAVKNLTISYGATPVIKRATFSISPGDFVCVVGANGSGKSTLVKAILGRIKPTSGSITIVDSCQRIGYFPQEHKTTVNFPATVQEIVLSGTLPTIPRHAFYTPACRAAASRALATLRLSALASRSFNNLSGGEKQKVLLARALATDANLLILDEPSNNLDYHSRHDFYTTLGSLNQSGLTIIMITHDLDTNDLIGNRILSIEGAAVSSYSTAEFLRRFR